MGPVVEVGGCQGGARLRRGDAKVGQGQWGGGMPMQGRIVKVDGCPCGAGSLRWRDADVGQGHTVEGCLGQPGIGGAEDPGGAVLGCKKGDLGGTGICGRGSQEGLWCEMKGCPRRAVW